MYSCLLKSPGFLCSSNKPNWHFIRAVGVATEISSNTCFVGLQFRHLFTGKASIRADFPV